MTGADGTFQKARCRLWVIFERVQRTLLAGLFRFASRADILPTPGL